MDQSGQVYFDTGEGVPKPDRRRYDEAEIARLSKEREAAIIELKERLENLEPPSDPA